MNKSYKIILVIIGAFVLLAALFAIVISMSKPAPKTPDASTNQPTTDTKPILQLDAQEETQVRQFVKNYVELYNNYSYGDYTNLTAVGDYETQKMQEKTLETIKNLQENTLEGFSQTAEADLSTFSYKYTNADTLSVSIKAGISQDSNSGLSTSARNPGEQKTKVLTEILTLKSYGKNWIVDDLETK